MSDRADLSALIKNAYYAARDGGGTMHTAGDDAADAILASDWLARVKAEAEVGILGDVITAPNDDPNVFLPTPIRRALEIVIDRIRSEAGIGGGDGRD